ncbi:MAG: DMT family transporter [Cytophagales bacterium]|jgi:drug/metabolite transporter (DMT)-like permease|nr:DMT family transporter [Cytophagales bacterium]
MKNLLAGVVFALLWASASVATKFGILSAHPLLLSNVRFFSAGLLLLGLAYTTGHRQWPAKNEWRQLAVYGLLNVTIYLGCFSWAMRYNSAGIGSLSTATNPLIISVLSAVWLRRTVRWQEAAGLLLGIGGVTCAVYPLLLDSYATGAGMAILAVSMLSYSVGTIYFSSRQWTLPLLVINGWQVLLGGLWLLPFTLAATDWPTQHYDGRFFGAVLWLAVVVSIGAVQLWLYLLRLDPVRASLWLFLCPIFGFIYAAWLMDEPVTGFTYAGTLLVVFGLWLAKKSR